MKTKIVSVSSFTLLFSLAMFSVASAESLSAVNVNVNAGVELGAQDNTVKVETKTIAQENATSDDATRKEGATSTESLDTNSEEQLTAETHRSAVASFVKSLLDVADREGGIGAEVRAIAKTQNDFAATSSEAMVKVENRGKIRTFFFGSDYKNLGHLRSEIAVTQNNIDKLKNLLDKTTSTTAKVELAAQIKVLEDSQVKLDTFVKTHENTFSLFGWFVKLFVK